MDLVQRLKNEGVQQGIQAGVHAGESTMLLRLLTKRFQHIPSSYMEKIQAASPEALLLWSEYVLDAKTIDDVFRSH